MISKLINLVRIRAQNKAKQRKSLQYFAKYAATVIVSDACANKKALRYALTARLERTSKESEAVLIRAILFRFNKIYPLAVKQVKACSNLTLGAKHRLEV